MLLRIFKIEIVPEFKNEFEEKFKVIALGLVDGKEGLLAAEIGKSVDESDNEYIMISIWKDLKALKEFTGDSWKEAVIPEEMQKYTASFTLKHYQEF